ncbi:MAG: hypothetical protein HY043_08270 [Verrucomicrobia bacterium]|nr:hypothetical protein [Verrucomicrobiota bacterium]
METSNADCRTFSWQNFSTPLDVVDKLAIVRPSILSVAYTKALHLIYTLLEQQNAVPLKKGARRVILQKFSY